jgi:Uncharacterized protein conserved in bacteria
MSIKYIGGWIIDMNDLTNLFWNAGLAELKQGYIYEPPSKEWVCLVCGERFSKGQIYPIDDLFFEAEKAAEIHIQQEHGSMFAFLLTMDKKYTGLTEHQKEILSHFYQGLNDKAIAAKMDNGNTSTVRNQRFAFRERAKQAKVFLAIMELLEEHLAKEDKFVAIPRQAVMVDQRFAITEKENTEVLQAHFPQGVEGPLIRFPKKEKKKVIILRQLIQRFDPQRKYNEKEVNEILKKALDDYVTLRRYLIEYGFMDRYPDGSCYWVKR